ncbi:unnamed protein product [Calypogeia fissa]
MFRSKQRAEPVMEQKITRARGRANHGRIVDEGTEWPTLLWQERKTQPNAMQSDVKRFRNVGHVGMRHCSPSHQQLEWIITSAIGNGGEKYEISPCPRLLILMGEFRSVLEEKSGVAAASAALNYLNNKSIALKRL